MPAPIWRAVHDGRCCGASVPSTSDYCVVHQHGAGNDMGIRCRISRRAWTVAFCFWNPRHTRSNNHCYDKLGILDPRGTLHQQALGTL